MGESHASDVKLPDPVEVSRSMAEIAERSRRLVLEFLERQAGGTTSLDPLNLGNAFLEMTAHMMADPA